MNVLALIGQLAHPGTRTVAAKALGLALGATDLLLFLRDPEVGLYLPASGFSQTLHGGGTWRAFVDAAASRGAATGRMWSPASDSELDAWGYRVEGDGVLVLIGGAPDEARVRELLPLFGLLTAIAARESDARQKPLLRVQRKQRLLIEQERLQCSQERTPKSQSKYL